MITQDILTAEHLAQKLENIKGASGTPLYPLERCEEILPLIRTIHELKEKKNAVILAHSYVMPEIIYGISDFTGDSYILSKEAAASKAETIVFAGVRFMAETAKILSPDRDVLLPGFNPGCSLADSVVSAEQIRVLREKYPDTTFVCYINTATDVKAQCDVCVTSGNVFEIVEKIPNDKIYFLPDKFMGQNLRNHFKRKGIKKDIRIFEGGCHVHEKYQKPQIDDVRARYPDVKVLSHPECRPEVCDASDFVGSTGQLLQYVKDSPEKIFFVLTECGLLYRIQAECPGKTLVGPFTECEYMKSNTLENIARVLSDPQEKDTVHVPDEIREKALKCIEAMFFYKEQA